MDTHNALYPLGTCISNPMCAIHTIGASWWCSNTALWRLGAGNCSQKTSVDIGCGCPSDIGRLVSQSRLGFSPECNFLTHGGLFPLCQLTRSTTMTLRVLRVNFPLVKNVNSRRSPLIVLMLNYCENNIFKHEPRTNPVLKWQLRSHKYTYSLPCSLTEQSFFQTWPAPGRDTWTMLRHVHRPRLTGKDWNEGQGLTHFFLVQRWTKRVRPLLAVTTLLQWKLKRLAGTLLAPPPMQQECQWMLIQPPLKGRRIVREQRPSPENLPMISRQQFLCFRMTGH